MIPVNTFNYFFVIGVAMYRTKCLQYILFCLLLGVSGSLLSMEDNKPFIDSLRKMSQAAIPSALDREVQRLNEIEGSDIGRWTRKKNLIDALHLLILEEDEARKTVDSSTGTAGDKVIAAGVEGEIMEERFKRSPIYQNICAGFGKRVKIAIKKKKIKERIKRRNIEMKKIEGQQNFWKI